VKPVPTRRVRKVLEARGCVVVSTEGSHEKWRTPGGLTNTIVAGDWEQSAGLLRELERVFAPQLGARWLQEDLRR
jgi:predicted RNA binding protein YcfA (HicA-like mRNA interferase family)